MGYSTNGIALYNIVNGLVASTTLAIVYNYDVKEITKYPCASISVKDGDEEELDTKNNLLRTRYLIRVQDQNVSVATMEARMRTLCDSILAELRKKANQTITGNSVRILPFAVTWGWFDGQLPTRMFEISVEVSEYFAI